MVLFLATRSVRGDPRSPWNLLRQMASSFMPIGLSAHAWRDLQNAVNMLSPCFFTATNLHNAVRLECVQCSLAASPSLTRISGTQGCRTLMLHTHFSWTQGFRTLISHADTTHWDTITVFTEVVKTHAKQPLIIALLPEPDFISAQCVDAIVARSRF